MYFLSESAETSNTSFSISGFRLTVVCENVTQLVRLRKRVNKILRMVSLVYSLTLNLSHKVFTQPKFYMNTFSLPKKGDYHVYFDTYISKVPDENYTDLILRQVNELRQLFSSKAINWSSLPYAEGKWTPKEVLGHMIDTERIMTFRALCFARGEKNPRSGFDQDPYVLNAGFEQVSVELLLEDFEAQRKALLTLIRTLNESVLDNIGIANGNPITPRALLWIIPGHFTHHFRILKEKY